MKSNTVYCSIIITNVIEITQLTKYLYKVNQMWKHLNVNRDEIPASHTNTKRIALLQTPGKTQTPPDTTTSVTIASFAFLAGRVSTVRTYLIFPHHTNGALAQLGVMGIGY
jgi:hypothetical protein